MTLQSNQETTTRSSSNSNVVEKPFVVVRNNAKYKKESKRLIFTHLSYKEEVERQIAEYDMTFMKPKFFSSFEDAFKYVHKVPHEYFAKGYSNPNKTISELYSVDASLATGKQKTLGTYGFIKFNPIYLGYSYLKTGYMKDSPNANIVELLGTLEALKDIDKNKPKGRVLICVDHSLVENKVNKDPLLSTLLSMIDHYLKENTNVEILKVKSHRDIKHNNLVDSLVYNYRLCLEELLPSY